MTRKALWLVTALVLALTGCSYKTAGAPGGRLTLYATFDDAQGLVAGHSVKMSDVNIGSVKKVELAGYKSRVTLSIKDGVRLPQGTRAEIKVTSLLGENYVDIILPAGGRLDRGPYLANRSVIANTSVQPAFEQVVGQAGPLLKALAGNDVAAVVDAGATALDGNGQKLNTTIAKSADLLKLFADQRQELGLAVDRFARLGRSLASNKDALGDAPGELAKATRVLNDDKEQILAVVQKLTRMAKQLNDKVLEGRVARFRTLLKDLDPVLAQLGGNRKRLTGLVNGLVAFTTKLPLATYDGQLLLYPILRLTWPDGSVVIPGQTLPGQKSAKSANVAKLPKDLRGALPGLDEILEPRS
ncbi:MlaD family protein [Actinomadura parmotrematis]|uniref:MCE family protein n=1 Tax=Actinomadura parmotrematis TaxID=2864039 RepID=A0ABS7G488_9ACTN|nr:MlaD family protein [Actinomadura parmotrematis]MBW8486669.1 MCE family protein [Actinomadura parmotrematis]